MSQSTLVACSIRYICNCSDQKGHIHRYTKQSAMCSLHVWEATTSAFSLWITPQISMRACLYAYSLMHLNQCWNIVNLALRNKLIWNVNRNSYMFIREIAFETVVCEMAVIFDRSQWVISFCMKKPQQWPYFYEPSTTRIPPLYMHRQYKYCTSIFN